MKRNIVFFLVLLIILSQFSSVAIADDEDFDTKKIMPKLSIENQSIPTGDANTTMTLSFNLKNSGYQARNVVITPEFIAENNPFTVSGLTNSHAIGNINGNTTINVKIKLNIAANAKAGTYPIRLVIDYENVFGDKGQFTETVYVKVSSKSTSPRLIIDKVSTDPKEIGPGQSANVSIVFVNKGTIEAKDISVTLEGLNSNGGFYIQNGSNVSYVTRVRGDSYGAVSFNLNAAKNIAIGSHELSVKFNYQDSQGTPYEDVQKIYLNVSGSKALSSNLMIENLNYPTAGIQKGEDFVFKFDLVNKGEMEASNIMVKAESEESGIVPKSSSIIKLNSISPGNKESLEFVFTPVDSAESKNYPIKITVEYQDELNYGTDNAYTLTQYIGAYVEGNEEGSTNKGKPKLIIDKYSFEPNIVKAGENFVMNLSFYNTNSQQTIKNVKIFLTSNETTDPTSNSAGSSVFTPVNSSNTFYIDIIPPKGRVEKSITMFTVPDAQAKTYTITANFEYENGEGEEFTATELIGVPVVQQSKLELGELSISPDAYVGQPSPVFIEFYNTGKVTLYNMMVKLEGDFQTDNGNYYVGNFEIGRSDYFEGMVIPTTAGEITGALVFTYEDSAGEPIEVRREFTINVMESMPIEDFPQDMPPMVEENTNIFKKPVFWVVIGAIVLAIVIVVIYKKRKKKGMSLDE